jgi:hypothetical protein
MAASQCKFKNNIKLQEIQIDGLGKAEKGRPFAWKAYKKEELQLQLLFGKTD